MARKIVLLCLAGLVLWIAADLFLPVRSDLHSFDPVQVAHLETDMWRAYYEHRPLALYVELVQLLRSEYRMPFWRAAVGAYHAAKAALVFQRGHQRSDYERALPDLISYYNLIRRSSTDDFNPEEVSRLELEWWIVHRERAKHQPDDLALALAALQSGIYHIPGSRFTEHARARAEAMVIRDEKAERLTSADWNRIQQLLELSWTSLFRQFSQ